MKTIINRLTQLNTNISQADSEKNRLLLYYFAKVKQNIIVKSYNFSWLQKNKRKETKKVIETKTHFKMYKAKTKWMVAGVTMFSTMLGAGVLANVHADNVSSSSSSQLPITDLNNQSKSYQASLQNYQKQQSQSSAIKSSVEVSSKPSQPVSIAEQSNPQYDKQVQTYQNSQQVVQQSSSTTVSSSKPTPVKSSVQVSTPKAATPVQKAVVSTQVQTNSNTQNAKPAAVMQSTPAAKPQARDAQQQITFGSCNDLNQVVVDLKNSISGDLNNQVQFNNGGGVKSVSENGNQLTITTNNDIDFQKVMTVTVDGQQYTIDPTNGTAMPVVRSQAFDNKYTYNGHDLGANYTPTATTFKIWAPTASQVSLNLYDNDTDPKAKLKSWQHMQYDENTGVWSITVDGDLKDTAYDYLVQFANGKSNETYDPYATACVQGGFRSVVLSPEEMGNDVTAGKVVDKDDPTNEVIGEIDVRDFTNDPSSGVAANVRGTYVGAVQSTNTTDGDGNPTGINYLTHQGINTVQIQPMYQYDDDGDNTNSSYEYDWGYDPENYNVPEGWYSTNRDDPATRIKECKEMIQAFHDAGIRVNMDVVYNHVANVKTNALALTVPGYYFRYGNNGQLTNASACGDDVASERNMVRNYIVQSCEYWHKVYGIDGFRFDLMGNLDVKTMNAIRAALSDVVMYGEGWNMGASIPDSDKADQANEKQMPTIGTFNGWGRTVIRGDDNGNPHGYITGQTGQQQMSSLANFIWGCQNLPNTPSNAVDGGVNYANPLQVINYTECHDNKTLYDTIRAAYPNENPDVSMRRAELGNAITILNEGVPYVQVGQGFGRSKDGDGNSYRSGDKVNNIHWDTQDNRTWATAYEKALIQLRNSDPAFRMTSYSDMNNNMKWIEINNDNGVIGYELTSPETGKKYIIAYSNNASSQQLTGLANGQYKVLIKNCNGYLDNPQTINVTDGSTDIPSLSCLVLEQDPVNNTKPTQNGGNSTSSSPSTSVKPATGSQSGTSTTTTKPSASTPVKPAGSSDNSSSSSTNKPASNGQSSSNTNSNVSKYTYTITYYDGNTGAQVGTTTFDSSSKLSDSQLANKVQSGTKDKVSSYNVDQDNVNGNTETISIIATVNKAQSNPKVYNYTVGYFNSKTGASEGTYSFTSNTPLSGIDLLNKIQSGIKDKVDSYKVDENHVTSDGNTDNISIIAIVGGNDSSSTSSPSISTPSGNTQPSSGTNTTNNSKPNSSTGSSNSNKPADTTNTQPSGSTSGKPSDKPSQGTTNNKPSSSTTGQTSSSSSSSSTTPDHSSQPANNPNDVNHDVNGGNSANSSKPSSSTSSTTNIQKPANSSSNSTSSTANSGSSVSTGTQLPDSTSSEDHASSNHETDETGNGSETPDNSTTSTSSSSESSSNTSSTSGSASGTTSTTTNSTSSNNTNSTVANSSSSSNNANDVNSSQSSNNNSSAKTVASKAKGAAQSTKKAVEKNVVKKSSQGSSASVDSSSQKGLENTTAASVAQPSTNVQNSSVSNNSGQRLPQTGETSDSAAEIGIAMLGVIGTVGLAILNKKYEN